MLIWGMAAWPWDVCECDESWLLATTTAAAATALEKTMTERGRVGARQYSRGGWRGKEGGRTGRGQRFLYSLNVFPHFLKSINVGFLETFLNVLIPWSSEL